MDYIKPLIKSVNPYKQPQPDVSTYFHWNIVKPCIDIFGNVYYRMFGFLIFFINCPLA